MTQSIQPDFLRVKKILMPFASKATEALNESESRFAYYTSSDTAYRIISNKEIWLRDATTMNDFSEIRFGWEQFQQASRRPEGKRFKDMINSIFPGLMEELGTEVADWMSAIHRDTYIACVSEHPPEEDDHGRLSMWRAYGGKSGVAIVFNRSIGEVSSNALGVYAHPVMYAGDEQVPAMLDEIAYLVEGERSYVEQLGREYVKNIILHTLLFGILSTKHRAFREEREWRVIACPRLHAVHHLKSDIEIVRGTPQTVLKVNLVDRPEHNIFGLDLSKLIDRVIIGPCDFPDVVEKALCTALEKSGVQGASARLRISNIPLRHF